MYHALAQNPQVTDNRNHSPQTPQGGSYQNNHAAPVVHRQSRGKEKCLLDAQHCRAIAAQCKFYEGTHAASTEEMTLKYCAQHNDCLLEQNKLKTSILDQRKHQNRLLNKITSLEREKQQKQAQITELADLISGCSWRRDDFTRQLEHRTRITHTAYRLVDEKLAEIQAQYHTIQNAYRGDQLEFDEREQAHIVALDHNERDNRLGRRIQAGFWRTFKNGLARLVDAVDSDCKNLPLTPAVLQEIELANKRLQPELAAIRGHSESGNEAMSQLERERQAWDTAEKKMLDGMKMEEDHSENILTCVRSSKDGMAARNRHRTRFDEFDTVRTGGAEVKPVDVKEARPPGRGQPKKTLERFSKPREQRERENSLQTEA